MGKTIKTAAAIEDTNVFGKVRTTGSEVAKALKGKKVNRCVCTTQLQSVLTTRRSSHPETKGNTSGVTALCFSLLCFETNSQRIVLDKPPHLVMHFGMTGKFIVVS